MTRHRYVLGSTGSALNKHVHACILDLAGQVADARAEAAAANADAIAAKRERDQAVADRDQWRRQAQLLADRYDDAREEIRRESALKARTEAAE